MTAQITRRRFIAISAAALALGAPQRAAALYQWRGLALGAEATIALAHPDAERLVRRARLEIERLEEIFSLYRAESALSRLNAEGRLEDPPFELLECLGLCRALNTATGGRFDPTVQPLWRLYAERHSAGKAPIAQEIAEVRELVAFAALSFDQSRVQLSRQGMALTLNGVAQGYIADKVAALLRAEGLGDVLVNTGEILALGDSPERPGEGWPVFLKAGDEKSAAPLRLRDRALASSSPLGTVFDAEGRVGHILDPLDGRPALAKRRLVSISAPSAAIADGLSTAGCLLERERLASALTHFPGARLEAFA